MRVVTWNVRSLRDDAAGVAHALRDLAPDVVLVQEAPRLWRSAAACRRLADRAGLRGVVGGRPAAGNLLLVGPAVTALTSYVVVVPKRRGLHRRAAVAAELQLAGGRLAVLGTHLDLDPAVRVATARRVRAAAPPGLPLVVGADVNDEPGSPAWNALAEGLVDAGAGLGPTFSVANPRRRIDALLVDPELAVQACAIGRTGPVSDHLPVIADLAWR